MPGALDFGWAGVLACAAVCGVGGAGGGWCPNRGSLVVDEALDGGTSCPEGSFAADRLASLILS